MALLEFLVRMLSKEDDDCEILDVAGEWILFILDRESLLEVHSFLNKQLKDCLAEKQGIFNLEASGPLL